MQCRTCLIAAAILLLASASAPGQTVQLPTFSSTSVGTTVVVPDRGSAFLGGISRAQSGRNEFGVPMLPFRPFKNTGIGQNMGASSMHVTATIHDFDAMEEALLGQSPESFARSRRLAEPAAAALARTAQPRVPSLAATWQAEVPRTSDRPLPTLADPAARRAAQAAVRAEEANDFFARARQAESDGKLKVAKVYYQMAARRASGQLKEQVLAKLEAMGGTHAPPRLAQSRP